MNELMTSNGQDVVKVQPTTITTKLEASGVATVQREIAEVQGKMTIAKGFPRNDVQVRTAIERAFSNYDVALGSYYKLPRGNQSISGKSVKFARELSRCVGNFESGTKVLEDNRENNKVTMRGQAVDLETNTWKYHDDTFELMVQRKDPTNRNNTIWRQADENEARELKASRGSKLERNAMLESLPGWAVSHAEAVAQHTLKQGAQRDLSTSKNATIEEVKRLFGGLGITPAQLKARLGHDLETVTEDELVNLRADSAAIRDKELTVQEWLDMTAPPTAADAMNAAMESTKS